MKINLVTHNPFKVKEFRSVLEPQISVEHIDLEYPELRSDDPEEIVKMAAMQLADKLQKSVVVEDSGLFIRALKGFPGTCTAYVFKRIGNEGLLRLLKGKKERTMHYKSAIGFCKPGGEPVSFLGIEEGRMSNKERGENGWGQDPIFIPKGKHKTYGESRKPGDVNLFRNKALKKLKAHLLNK